MFYCSYSNQLNLPQDAHNITFVDTVGWDDVDADDVEIFQNMLILLNRLVINHNYLHYNLK